MCTVMVVQTKKVFGRLLCGLVSLKKSPWHETKEECGSHLKEYHVYYAEEFNFLSFLKFPFLPCLNQLGLL